MSYNLSDIDAIIFDMDGTMWNATESYAKVWNQTCASFGMEAGFKGSDLVKYMGMSIDSILDHLLGDDLVVGRQQFLEALAVQEDAMMPLLGGELYPGIVDCLEQLSRHYRLFMLSNCSARGLINFVNATGTAHFFEGLLTQGERPVEKSENLKYMTEKYSLKCPTYVGDTQEDCNQAHNAGLPFVHAQWGFGSCSNAEWHFVTIQDLTQNFLNTTQL